MTILNNANDGDYPILCNVLNALLMSDNCLDKNKLFKVCGGEILLTDGKKLEKKKINDTFLTWKSLGLLRLNGSDVSIEDQYFEKFNKIKDLSEKDFKLLLIDILLSPQNNKNFWSDDGGGSSDFTRGSTYLFARDIFNSGPLAEFATTDTKKGSEVKLLQNSNRWNALTHWMNALALMNSGFIADPTLLIKSFMENHKEKGMLTLKDFISELAIRYPILDGGQYRKKLESELVGPSFDLLKQNKLSISLSTSLLRLRSQGHIELSVKSDAPSLILCGKGMIEREAYSHINIKKVKK